MEKQKWFNCVLKLFNIYKSYLKLKYLFLKENKDNLKQKIIIIKIISKKIK